MSRQLSVLRIPSVTVAILLLGSCLPSLASATATTYPWSDGRTYCEASAPMSPLHGDDMQVEVFQDWASATGGGLSSTTPFKGGVVVGDYLWTIANSAKQLTKMHKNTGVMEVYKDWTQSITLHDTASWDGVVFDGSDLWLIPSRARGIVQVDVTNGAVKNIFAVGGGTYTKATGATYTNGYIWTTPSQIDHVMRIATEAASETVGDITQYTATGDANAFDNTNGRVIGAAFDGTMHWMAPFTGNHLVGVDTTNPSNPMTTYAKSTFYNINGVEIGTDSGDDANRWFGPVHTQNGDLYLIPIKAYGIVKIETQNNGALTGYTNWPAEMASALANWPTTAPALFSHAAYDGRYIWIIPRFAGLSGPLRFDTQNGQMKNFVSALPTGVTGDFTTGNPFGGFAFDPVDSTFFLMGDNVDAILKYTVRPEACDTQVDCAGNAASVTGDKFVGCTCNCNTGYSASSSCSACAANYVSTNGVCAPALCDEQADCNGNGYSVSGDKVIGCSCTCITGYDSATSCGTCADGYEGSPCVLSTPPPTEAVTQDPPTPATGAPSTSVASSAVSSETAQNPVTSTASDAGSSAATIDATTTTVAPSTTTAATPTNGPSNRVYLTGSFTLSGDKYDQLINTPALKAKLVVAVTDDLARILGIPSQYITIIKFTLGSLITEYAILEGAQTTFTPETISSAIKQGSFTDVQTSYRLDTDAGAAATIGVSAATAQEATPAPTTAATPTTTTEGPSSPVTTAAPVVQCPTQDTDIQLPESARYRANFDLSTSSSSSTFRCDFKFTCPATSAAMAIRITKSANASLGENLAVSADVPMTTQGAISQVTALQGLAAVFAARRQIDVTAFGTKGSFAVVASCIQAPTQVPTTADKVNYYYEMSTPADDSVLTADLADAAHPRIFAANGSSVVKAFKLSCPAADVTATNPIVQLESISGPQAGSGVLTVLALDSSIVREYENMASSANFSVTADVSTFAASSQYYGTWSADTTTVTSAPIISYRCVNTQWFESGVLDTDSGSGAGAQSLLVAGLAAALSFIFVQ